MSLVGAYVLAGELPRADGNHLLAHERYEATVRGYARSAQKVNAGRLLAPTTRIGITLRNRRFSVSALFAPLMKLVDHLATDIELHDHEPAPA